MSACSATERVLPVLCFHCRRWAIQPRCSLHWNLTSAWRIGLLHRRLNMRRWVVYLYLTNVVVLISVGNVAAREDPPAEQLHSVWRHLPPLTGHILSDQHWQGLPALLWNYLIVHTHKFLSMLTDFLIHCYNCSGTGDNKSSPRIALLTFSIAHSSIFPNVML